MQQKTDIKSLYLDELEQFVKQTGEPGFRAKQIFSWLHQKNAQRFEDMTNLPKSLAAKFDESCEIKTAVIKKKLVSKIDSTVKYLMEFNDGEHAESVVMKYKHGYSICISSQVGCKMGCKFCASTKAGFVRNLTASEILSQVYTACADMGVRIGHIVMMGIGEPLDNFDNVVRFLKLIGDPNGYNISQRNISLSTCGLVDKINRLAELRLGVTLSISLHASCNEIRSTTMPVNDIYPIETLISACNDYAAKTSRRISYEYALIKGVNDSKEDADRLVKLLKGTLSHVNLIPVNEIKETDFKKSDAADIKKFQKYLCDNHINATVRRTLGTDINAACGQLRRDEEGI